MKTLAIVGSQWGDEGKGKITDLLGQKCDVVVRYQGGNNAGHTIIVEDQVTILHLIPSGILHPHCVNVIGHGVVFDPAGFAKELEEVTGAGVSVTPENLKISDNCCVITSHHKLLDELREQTGPVEIGTTGRGIGPAYEDKVGRSGIKVKDLLDKKLLMEKLAANLREKEVLFKHLYKTTPVVAQEEANRLIRLGEVIKPFVTDTFEFIDQCVRDKKKILFEGAQGILLDIDYGYYPFVTSSNTSVGGVYTGVGLPGLAGIDEVLGIAKAYTTRVGKGPFPTELNTSTGQAIQQKGKEFGATTGRRRRCGWPDLPLLRYAVKAGNITSLALTKLDILSSLGELKVCHSYRYRGRTIDCAWPGIDLAEVEPLYRDLRPFDDTFDDGPLSQELCDFIALIEDAVHIPVGIVAYGPRRDEIRFLREYF